ncbi:hypothetical protein M9458_007652, partial [Cirrhinus mrigala]
RFKRICRRGAQKRLWVNVFVDIFTGFIEQADELIPVFSAPPDVYVFANMYIRDKNKLKLTCMATGFYFKDVIMTIRKNRTPVPEDEIESTQIRPNEDGTFQLTKSVEISKDDEVDCFVSPRTYKEPIIIKWGN